MNKVIFIGRTTAAPELRYTPAGKPVATFTLAVEREYKDEQGNKPVDFIRHVVWGKLAEVIANNVGKGRLLATEGRLQIRTYETPEGQKRQVAEVVAENVRFLDWPKDKSTEAAEKVFGSSTEQYDGDLPF